MVPPQFSATSASPMSVKATAAASAGMISCITELQNEGSTVN
jgi:hypothetical protein